jgi:6-phosphogluconolactonase (cycloisomerase 2 family)
MSKIALSPDASGTGTFTLASPNSNTNRTLTLPDAAGELLTTTGDGSGLTGIVIPPVFKPVAVTGTTPSLDVGTYNYFDNGTLSADTTVTFASVPTEANWRYNFVAGLLNAWDISTSSYLQLFSVTSQDTSPFGIFFKPDGTKMYVLGLAGVDVNEYNLSTAWDVSTAVFLQLVSVSPNTPGLRGLFFKPDGLKMYVAGSTDDAVDEYNLSTAWDVSTVTYLQTFSVAAQEIVPNGLFFKPDGLKMYVTGSGGDDVNEYDLSTAWDVSTAVYLQNFSVATQDTSPYALSFKPDGTKMYIMGAGLVNVNEYDLSTAWDVSTASFLQLFSVAAQEAGPRGLFFKPDGTKMYVSGGSGRSVYEYNLGAAVTVTLPAAVVGTPSALSAYDRVTYEFVTLDGGTTVNLIAEEVIAP